jgi:hypothetical protein
MKRSGVFAAAIAVLLFASAPAYSQGLAREAAPQPPLTCDLTAYTARDGLTAEAADGGLLLNWLGSDGETVRLTFANDDGYPIVRDLSLRGAAATGSLSPPTPASSSRSSRATAASATSS